MKATQKEYAESGRMSSGWRYSLAMHFVVLLLVIFGLPAFFDAQREAEPMAISVEIVPITGKTNIKPSAKQEAPELMQPKEQPKPVQEASATVKPKPAPTPAPQPTPPPPPKEVVSPNAPKEEKKPEPVKDEPKPQPKEKEKKPEKKKPDESLDDILKKVADSAKKESPQSAKTENPKDKKAAPVADNSDHLSKSTSYDASQPLSMSETDALRSQIIACWHPPTGGKDQANMVFTLRLKYNADGTIAALPVLASNQGRYASDGFYKAMVDSGMRAVRLCSPLKNMPAEKFGTWGDTEMEFNPANVM